ncbi:type II toxin-antitoxin system toxin DNA ADP-ribosyl transferase DarT [Verminephrobacter aporrectodeae]|uniref:DUF4433 domain-containing protein n=1 Tax=Verminephrobacter aporrectodeae subsp. tuberculatae TaxID=1110392 RepID=A0ABT3KYQ4_9BURK|nr:DUF4433 domain-containing protein [Verminephrobacter aporrectodeae]MCW5323454.1 DUF4433 domain-containing protein [Verminephrobacter aporrectodeae subsp. tuberculatae]MCW8176180.1 DUF4433 domain-containing protein [Verminephrobacter aporrectodeae subsp. tuberculatae]MCW8203808.1 DUF4433 domain-containing protein [Verminephrobacter aporrectodeae subsp. tuberculatae]
MNALLVPPQPKIYHIAHVDRLPSIVADGFLWCDAEIVRRAPPGTTIGMGGIKHRRLNELRLSSHTDLFVGDCVPFYFCPRSVMLYLIHRDNHPEMTYHGGQGPIVHLEADLRAVIAWANGQAVRWAFTLSNAGSRLFEDRNDLARLNEINWTAVQARNWQEYKEGKQAEFLLEQCFPWRLIERIGIHSAAVYGRVVNALSAHGHRPTVEVRPDWYY